MLAGEKTRAVVLQSMRRDRKALKESFWSSGFPRGLSHKPGRDLVTTWDGKVMTEKESILRTQEESAEMLEQVKRGQLDHAEARIERYAAGGPVEIKRYAAGGPVGG